jgi:hypothetical protein
MESSFFCKQHDLSEILPRTPPTLSEVRVFLGNYQFDGTIRKDVGEYVLILPEMKKRTGIRRVSDSSLAQWLRAWASAEILRHQSSQCRVCRKKFVLTDNAGVLCECGHTVCLDCLSKHQNSADHLTAHPVMDRAGETKESIERNIQGCLRFLSGDLFDGGLPSQLDERQTSKAKLLWLQDRMAEKIPESF